MNKTALKWVLAPNSPIPQGEKGNRGHSMFSFFSWSYWWNPQCKGVKMLQVVGMKNPLYTDTFISMQLFFMRQMIPPAWLAGWECKVKCLGEVLFKAEHSCFTQMGEKNKGGENKAGRQRERISIHGKDLINKNKSTTTLWACKRAVNSWMI